MPARLRLDKETGAETTIGCCARRVLVDGAQHAEFGGHGLTSTKHVVRLSCVVRLFCFLRLLSQVLLAMPTDQHRHRAARPGHAVLLALAVCKRECRHAHAARTFFARFHGPAA